MEGVILQGFGDVVLEGPRDVGSDKRITSAEVGAHAEQFRNTRQGGVWPQRGSYLSAVFYRKQTEVVVALLDVTPDMLVYTFDHSRTPEIGGIHLKSNEESAAPSAATPPASAQGAVVVDTRRSPLAEQNHPRAVTILQSPNGSNID